ncbi:4-fold beta flower protein [Halonotius roseus]|uniref:4-fold beta flower domain-containing protein n=1 Tax=Halonotius roseus TaxID=2511997 RepID=A0A544QN50_9EURY|nr:hypothetical protein [Halonotius roseus]TQQ80304.1 hypothetical protein EWF95_07345 [Halonotius roseus]
MTTFYNKSGKPIAYTENNKDIYLFTGEPVAFISSNSLYSFSGTHLGWLKNGWVIDPQGDRAFFTENASGSGPAKPAKHAKPAKSAKSAKPAKGAKEAKPAMPALSLSWSSMSSKSFFEQ